MAAKFLPRAAHPFGSLRRIQWLAHHLLSFETFFLLFLYGTQIRQILPSVPGNEALVFGAVTMAMGGWIILRDGIYLRGVPIVLAGLLLIGWMVVSLGWTPSRFLARQNLTFLLTVDLWALFAGACIIAGSRLRAVRLLMLIMGLALILSVYGIYIDIVHGSFRFFHYQAAGAGWSRATYIQWGQIVSSGAVAALALVIFSKIGSLKQVLGAAGLAVCLYFLLVATGRGALLALLLAGLLAAVIQAPRISRGRIEIPQTQLVALAVLTLALFYVVYLYTTGQTTGAIYRFLRLFEEADDPLLRAGANRFDYFAAAYQIWLSAPMFGRGLSSFAPLYSGGLEIAGTYPHNAILQILAEFGLVGLALFVLFVVAGLRFCGLARLRQDPLQLVLAMLFATILVQTMVAGDFTQSYRFFFIVGLLAIRPPVENEDEDEEEDEDEPQNEPSATPVR